MGYGGTGSSDGGGSSYGGTGGGAPQLSSSHSSGGFFSHFPNLGGVTAVKQLVSGIPSLFETAIHPTRWDDFGRGIVTSLGNITSTAAKPLDIFTRPFGLGSISDDGIEKMYAGLDRALGGEGNKPQDILEMSRAEGPIAAVVNQVGTVAMFAAPIAGALGKASTGARVAATEAATLAEATAGTAEGVVNAANAAKLAARAASLESKAAKASAVAHPYRAFGGKFADLTKGASEAVYPGVSALPETGLAPHEIAARDAEIANAGIAGQLASMDHPVQAAAKTVGGTEASSLFAEAGVGVPPGHVRFSRVGAPGAEYVEGMPNPSRASGSSAADMGRVHTVDVPEAIASKLARGPNGEVEIPPEFIPQEHAPNIGKVKLPRSGEGFTPSGADDAMSHIEGAVQGAREGVNAPAGAEAAAVAKRITRPAPAWAVRAAEVMPDSVNRVLAKAGKPMERMRLHAVQRDMARYVEITQRVTRSSEAVKASRRAAEVVLEAVPGLKRGDISRIVGETVGAEMDGTAFLAAAIKDSADVSPELAASLKNVAKRSYKGITDEQLKAFSPEQRAAWDGAIADAVEAWKVEKTKTMETLLASSKGAQGLEQYLLADENPTMTTSQVRRYRRAMADYRRADWVMRRHPEMLAAREAEIARASLVGEKAAEESVKAQELVGNELRSADTLSTGTPEALRPQNIAGAVHTIVNAIINPADPTFAGITYDVGMNKVADVSGQTVVGLAQQWDPIPVAQFAIDGPALVRRAMEHPIDINGNPYGPGVWAGADARLGMWVGEDGLVYGDIGIGSWRGKNLTRSQAVHLGEAFKQQALWDGVKGEEITLSGAEAIQNLHAQYLDDVLNPTSDINRFSRELEDVADKAGIDPESVDSAMRSYMTWDYSLSRTNAEWTKGDYFKKAAVQFGKKPPTSDALMQTVLGLTTEQGYERALASFDGPKLKTALAWYYESHDYIEQTWRFNPDGSEKMLRLLDGSERSAAEVFYDLIAVTSVQASPTQNFGRALMALGNMDEFLRGRKSSSVTALALMKKLEEMQPEVMAVTGIGTEGENVLKAAKGVPGTRLSNKFLTPEVRRLTEQTSMTNGPKYNVMDVLSGRLKLDQASTADIGRLPEFWTGKPKRFARPELADPQLMEHYGSKALAKLRSFRDNLSHPEESLAVTLDSVMAKMYGFKGTDWGLGGKYAAHAAQIREAAVTLSERFGREVKPHEVQALLWVYTKMEVGRQDWGRLLAHHDLADGEFVRFAKEHAEGTLDPLEVRRFDPLAAYWEEELGYGQEGRTARQEVKRLKKEQKLLELRKLKLAPEQAADLADYERQIQEHKTPLQEDTLTAANRDDLAAIPEDDHLTPETRTQIPGDAQAVARDEGRYNSYAKKVLPEIRKALATGDTEQARRILTSYLAKQKRGILGDTGQAFHTVAEATLHDPESSAFAAAQKLAKAKHVPKPNEFRGGIDELHSMFNEKLKGALLTNPNKSGRLVMRMFEGADLGTLLHEGAHLLRQILPEDMMGTVELHYPGITDRALTTLRRGAEERFVGDLMYWMRGVDRGATIPGMAGVFNKIGATLEDQFAAVMDTADGRSLNNDIVGFWDRMFNPEIVTPNKTVDPINLQRVAPGGVETKRFRWESEAEFAQRARQYGEARERVQTAKFKANLKAKRAGKANDAVNKLRALLDEPTRAQALADKLNNRGTATLDKLAKEMDAPTLGQVAGNWQPMWEAVMDLHAEAVLDETGQVAEALAEIPETFSEVMRFAAERGFDPTHIQDLTWEKATSRLFDHVQLGAREETSGTRKARVGVLGRANIADRSIEALASSLVDATHELYTNKLVSFIEENYAKPLERGAPIPDGWAAWEPERTYVMTGTRPGVGRVAVADTHIVPVAVKSAIESMSKSYDHWTFHAITRVTSPWRTLMLTLSPKWYVNNFFGNIALASIEGVRLRDWHTAWKQYRSKAGLPKEVVGHSFFTVEGESSVIPRGVRSTKQSEGMRAAKDAVVHKLTRLNEVVDEFSRAAVYDMHLRKGASREAAITRSNKAMVDYGDLSPFERSYVRAVIPFYSWQKGMFKLLAHFPTDHPFATGMLLQLGQLHEEYLKDQLGGTIPDAYLGLADLGGWRNTRALNPFQDALQIATPEGIGQSINPYVDIFLRMAYNKPEYGSTMPGMSGVGGPEEKVNPLAALGGMLGGLPQTRLLEQNVGGSDIYGQSPGVLDSVANFLGKPRGYSPEEMKKIADRIAKTQEDNAVLDAGGRTFSHTYMPKEKGAGKPSYGGG